MNKIASKFEEEYFKNNKSSYLACFDYQKGNIAFLYERKILPIFKKNLGKNLKVLDIGCALGTLLSMLDKEGYETYGIDISNFAIREAQKYTRADLKIGNVNKCLPYQGRFFDAVFALDIIEHLDSPIKFALEVKRILKKGGLFFVHTPNINSIFEKIFKKSWFGYKDNTHIYLFNKKSLKFLLEKAGLKVIINETISYPLPAPFRRFFENTDLGGSLWMIARKI